MLADEGADTGILACEHHPKVLRVLLCIVLRIGVQAPEHGVDARADGFFRADRVHIEQLQVLVQLIEDVEMLGHLKVVVTVLLSLRRKRQSQEHKQRCDISFHITFLLFYLLFVGAKLHVSLKKTRISSYFLQKI